MTREETLAWAKSLRPGDTVIHRRYNSISVLAVAKVTPAGWVKTTDGGTFSQVSWADSMRGRGSLCGEIVPATEELLRAAQKQDQERKERESKDRIVTKARNRIWDECNKRYEITYEKAAKILEFFDRLDAETKETKDGLTC